jgi:3-isopropylmalate dehydratase small subunit
MNTVITGVTMVLGDHVNTDIHCSTKYLPGKDNAYVAERAFEKLDPAFSAQAKAYREAGQAIVLVAGKDFGINSSREQAAQILMEIGVGVVIAPSFARAFFRNSMNNGLALLSVDISGIHSGQAISVNLKTGDIDIQGAPARKANGLSEVLLQMVSAGGLLAYLDQNKGWPPVSA